jgi:hypothetical protein
VAPRAPGQEIPDGHVFTQPWPAGPADRRKDQVICYQYKADRARRTLRGIDEQVAKAAKAVAGLARSSGTAILGWRDLRDDAPVRFIHSHPFVAFRPATTSPT